MTMEPPLIAGSEGWNILPMGLPSKYERTSPEWAAACSDPLSDSQMRPANAKQPKRLNRYILKAIFNLLYPGTECAVYEIGEDSWSSEAVLEKGRYLLAKATATGKLDAAVVTESGRTRDEDRFEAVEPLGTKSTLDTSSILTMYVLMLCKIDKAAENALNELKAQASAGGKLEDLDLRHIIQINEGIIYGLETKILKSKIEGGNVSMLRPDNVKSGSLKGNLVCGTPNYLKFSVKMTKEPVPRTIAEAQKLVEEYTKNLSWSEEEKAKIPQFPPDFKVPEEVWQICNLFIRTRGRRKMFNNFGWRGSSGFGKSTGVRILGCILNTPVYVLSCNSTMETLDLLAKELPDTSSAPSELPSIESMVYDPEGSYLALTGEFKEGATAEDCQQAYAEALQKTGGAARFRLVKSDLVKALETGAIVEIQEYNIIRDPGVLKGLNAYSDPGSLISLVDGTYTRRLPNAITVWTANVGSVASRESDESVLRRLDYIIDSYDLDKDRALERIAYNTEGELDVYVTDTLYECWNAIRQYCKEQQIHSDLSLVSLENWCVYVANFGLGVLKDSLRRCVISQCTSDRETQDTIYVSVAKPCIETLLQY